MNIKATKIGNVTGIISLIIFVICMFWGLLLASPELKDLHFGLIQVFYPGYSLTAFGIVLGLIESYLYGWLIGAGFMWLCKKICK